MIVGDEQLEKASRFVFENRLSIAIKDSSNMPEAESGVWFLEDEDSKCKYCPLVQASGSSGYGKANIF